MCLYIHYEITLFSTLLQIIINTKTSMTINEKNYSDIFLGNMVINFEIWYAI